MQSVFVAGSITIKKLPSAFAERLATLVEKGLHVLVGDANGADKAIQEELRRHEDAQVTVYCAGLRPRNNLGNWSVRTVASDAKPGTRQYFVAKDLAMASIADFGLMLWDSKSPGTLGNVIELSARGKPSVVFLVHDGAFATVRDSSGLKSLVDRMTPEARAEADTKIDLSARLSGKEPQLGFGF
jgi:hypothetical protein